ncbi:hypothetical protein GCM10027030_08860 [Luteococcus sediminum]
MVLIALVAVPLAFVLTGMFTQRRRTRLLADPATHPGLAHLDRASILARRIGVAAGTVLGIAAAMVLPLGRGVLLAPSLFSLVLVLALVATEARLWRSARTPGIAGLETRNPVSYLPRALLLGLGATSASLLALLTWCAAHQNTSPDGMGIIGRAFEWRVLQSPGDPGVVVSTKGPFPGTWYSMPIAVVLVGVLLVLVLGLGLVLRRPRNGADPVVVAIDDQARMRNAEAMTAAALLGVAGSLLACSLLAAMMVLEPFPWLALALVVSALCALLACTWAISVLLVPGRGMPVRSTPASGATAMGSVL